MLLSQRLRSGFLEFIQLLWILMRVLISASLEHFSPFAGG
jgi:hypothetical protein